jgi:hypothetical protein
VAAPLIGLKLVDNDGSAVGLDHLANPGLTALPICGQAERPKQVAGGRVNRRLAAIGRTVNETVRTPGEDAADRRHGEPAQQQHHLLRISPDEALEHGLQTKGIENLHRLKRQWLEAQVEVSNAARNGTA